MLYLHDELKTVWQNKDPFEKIAQLDGKVYRLVKNRRTFQFTSNGKSYFIKEHKGVGWLEIVKNLIQLRMPILGARNEWLAIQKLAQLNVKTMEAVGYGERGMNPANRKSFIITRDLTDTVSLEDYCRDWFINPPDVDLKRKLISQIAITSKILHHNGFCHRDYYICHFLMHKSTIADSGGPTLSLIDLHRSLIKSHLGRRWIVKDIAGLYFSAMDAGLGKRDLLRFIKIYEGRALKHCLSVNRRFWQQVDNRAKAMYLKVHGKQHEDVW